MKNSWFKFIIICSFCFISTNALAGTFTLLSADISDGEFLTKAQEFNGFGCDGGNVSPQLSWVNAPKDTAAFAITVYDPDAPTGSGWWHWQIINIGADVTSLPTGAGKINSKLSPKGSRQISNDYSMAGFGGACPPKGDAVHRYRFTVYALSKKLELPKNASSALTGYMINAHTLDSSTIEALYKR